MEFGVTEQNSEWDFRVGFRSLGQKYWMERSKCQKGKGNGKWENIRKVESWNGKWASEFSL